MLSIYQKLNKLIDETDVQYGQEEIIKALPLIHTEIYQLFSLIKQSKNINESAKYFDLIDTLHYYVCQIMFVREIKVPKEFWKFVKDFDRTDDQDQRLYLFQSIKDDSYKLSNKGNAK